jgi:copper(I)-binding protein
VHDVTASGATPSSGTRHVPSGPVTIGAGATLTLAPRHGHVMLTGLTGRLRPGDDVSLLLSFQRSGQLLVELPVIAIGEAAPDGSLR